MKSAVSPRAGSPPCASDRIRDPLSNSRYCPFLGFSRVGARSTTHGGRERQVFFFKLATNRLASFSVLETMKISVRGWEMACHSSFSRRISEKPMRRAFNTPRMSLLSISLQRSICHS